MTNNEFIEDKYATVRDWVNTYHYDPVIGWDLFLEDLVIDSIDPERDEWADQVEDFLKKFEDHPEMHGCPIPIYYADTFDIYDRNGSEVDDVVEEIGGLKAMVEEDSTLNSAISAAVCYFVDSAARQAAHELLGEIDTLTDMLDDNDN